MREDGPLLVDVPPSLRTMQNDNGGEGNEANSPRELRDGAPQYFSTGILCRQRVDDGLLAVLGRRSTIIPPLAPVFAEATGNALKGYGTPREPYQRSCGQGGVNATEASRANVQSNGGNASPSVVTMTKEMLERFYELASPLVTQVWCHTLELDVLTEGGAEQHVKVKEQRETVAEEKNPPTCHRLQVIVAVAVMSPEPFLCWARQRVRARNLKGSNASHRNASHQDRRKSAAGIADDGEALQGRVSAPSALDDAQPQHHGRGLEALSASSEAVERVTRDFDEAADAYGLSSCYKVAKVVLETTPFSTENALQTPLYQLCRAALKTHYGDSLALVETQLHEECAKAGRLFFGSSSDDCRSPSAGDI